MVFDEVLPLSFYVLRTLTSKCPIFRISWENLCAFCDIETQFALALLENCAELNECYPQNVLSPEEDTVLPRVSARAFKVFAL